MINIAELIVTSFVSPSNKSSGSVPSVQQRNFAVITTLVCDVEIMMTRCSVCPRLRKIKVDIKMRSFKTS